MPRRPSARIAAPLLASILLAFAVVTALQADLVSAQTFTPGTQARVSADGDSLRMRAGATVSAAIIASIPDGSIVNIREGTTTADGYTWQFVDWNGAIGWVASDFLQPLGATSTPSATATPSATTTPTVTVTPIPTTPSNPGTGTITGSLPPAGKAGLIVWGGGSMDALVATAAGQGCNVRSVYTVRDGLFVGYTPSAPDFVNAGWVTKVGELTGVSAVLVFCDATSQAAASAPPPSDTTAPATTDNRPPGPGGNEG